MKILITVGTTPFDRLIKKCDSYFYKNKAYTVKAQIAQGKYVPKNIEYLRFTPNIGSLYEWSDLIICHAGAGTVYNLLERQKKIIVVPNLDRRESHQLDICKFLIQENFALVLNPLENLEEILHEANNSEFRKYENSETELVRAIAKIVNDDCSITL